jgi:hypothetical protein
MLRRFLVVGALVVTTSAYAVAPKTSLDTLTARRAAGVSKPLRLQQKLRYGGAHASAAWQSFAATGKWDVAWDQATGVPSRIWGSGIPAPGTVANAATAAAFSRQFLATHLELLAPGASASDFELVSNVFDGDLRAVGFVQKHNGIRVVGGQVSFRFKNDRLFVIGSEALPNVSFTAPAARARRDDIRSRVRAEVSLPVAPVTVAAEDVILPLVADDAILGYKLVTPATVEGTAERYLVYTDAGSGQVVALQQLDEYAAGTVLYHGVDRYPLRGRLDQPAPRAHVKVNGTATTTSMTGGVSWTPESTATLDTSIEGDLAVVVNKSSAATVAHASLPISPGGQTVWDASAAIEDDAQVSAYLNVNIAKEYVRRVIDPNMPTLDEPMTANVNIAMDCNAFFDGKSLNFFRRTPAGSQTSCENTALIQDVVYHEYGHRVHTAEIIDGVGAFDGAMSEGVADILAVMITHDSGMGRGFFMTDAPLRELDPPGMEWMWPYDISEIHHTGMIIGGVFWDLRQTLIAQLGDTLAEALLAKLYAGALRRSISIPTTLIEVLATDDDDGDLSNGTPHECAIRDAYGRHGLRTASGSVEAPGTTTATQQLDVLVTLTGISGRCMGDSVASAKLEWRPGYTGIPEAGSTAAVPVGPNRFSATLPLPVQETVFYRVMVTFTDGSSMYLADNLADTYYQLYQGDTVKLYCTDFEKDPFAEGWTTGSSDGKPSGFEWGPPGAGGPTDPHVAYSGSRILGQKLGGDYEPSRVAWVKSPEIDVTPYSDVRLQYRRWLAVEDSHYDTARVLANDTKAWVNSTQNMGDSSSYHHLDKEWRFQDVPLSGFFSGKKLVVTWDLTSDQGLELGGWQMDDVCIVANPNAICGDGVKTPTEQCDKGTANADAPNVCRTDCRLPTCGDGIIDDGEDCDDNTELCSDHCRFIPPAEEGGCCSADGGRGSLVLGLLVGGLMLRRRRR